MIEQLVLRLRSIRTRASARTIVWLISICLQFTAATPFFAQSVGTENEVSSQTEELQIQSDGKILIGGTRTRNGVDSFALVRFLKDGTVDTTFGNRGRVSTLIGRGSKLRAFALQPDGKIVAAGYSDTGKTHVVAVARYNLDGSLDTTFGSGGKATTAAAGNYARAFSVLIQTDGKIIAAGHSNSTPRGFDIFLVRYNPDGSIDKTFGRSGVINTPLGQDNNGGQAAFLQPDGKIVAVGQISVAGKQSIVAARYTPAGMLDATFAMQGKASIPTAGKRSSAGVAAALGDYGSFAVGGYSSGADVLDNTGEILLLDKNGTLDRSFARAGRLSIPDADITILRPEGENFIAAGRLGESTEAGCRAYQRIGRTGTLLGSAALAIDEVMCEVSGLAIQSDGRILVAGAAGSHMTQRIALLGFDKEDKLDGSFGSNGLVISDF